MRLKLHANFLEVVLVCANCGIIIFLFQEEDLYEIDIPLSFVSSVGTRVHGLACWFDVLFNGRSEHFCVVLICSALQLIPSSISLFISLGLKVWYL
jgi:ABC-type enterochelin transport system permease subunit